MRSVHWTEDPKEPVVVENGERDLEMGDKKLLNEVEPAPERRPGFSLSPAIDCLIAPHLAVS